MTVCNCYVFISQLCCNFLYKIFAFCLRKKQRKKYFIANLAFIIWSWQAFKQIEVMYLDTILLEKDWDAVKLWGDNKILKMGG